MRRPSGFTLIELMVVIAIIAIIAAIAIPAYTEQVRKSRRAEASRFIGQMQLELERWRAENPCYGQSGGACPTFTASGTYPAEPTATVSPFYTVVISGATPTAYTITAARRTGSAQANDRCGSLVATQTGKPTWATSACN